MTTHHLIRDFQIQHCLYCRQDLTEAGWNSEFEAAHHYKSVRCSCGKKNTVVCDFWGSGHDRWEMNFKSGGNGGGFEHLVEGEHKKVQKEEHH